MISRFPCRLALSLASGGTFNKDQITEDLILPTEMETSDGKTIQGLKITWESDSNAIRTDGRVVRPSKKNGNATVNLKATIQYGSYSKEKTFANLTVLALDGASFVEFDEAYAEAEGKYETAKAENIYTDASLAAMKAKLEAADAIKATEGKPEEDTKWVTVTNKGKVTTKKAGKGKTVKITVTSTDGTNKKATVKIKITK